MLRKFLLPALPVLFACAPAVTHGPRVEPGASLVITGGAPRPLCSEFADCHGGVTPTFGAGVRYGYVPQNPEGAPVMVGVTVPVFDVLAAELDGYVQAPSAGTWAWGGGALVSRRHLMPYLEAGRMPAGGGDGWYLSAGYAHLFHDPTADFGPDDSDGESMPRPPRYWAPGAGARVNFRGVRWTVFVNGAFGSYVKRNVTLGHIPDAGPVADTVDTRKNIRTLLLGITWEVPFRDIHRQQVPTPRRRPPPAPEPQPLPPPMPGPR